MKQHWETGIWKEDYENWLSDKQLIEEGGNQSLYFSSKWIEDRNKLLEMKLAFNADNQYTRDDAKDYKVESNLSESEYLSLIQLYSFGEGFYGKDWYFSDLEKKESYTFNFVNNQEQSQERIVFGTDEADSDYIEGNEGNDTLYGGAGRDFIDGGEGDILYDYAEKYQLVFQTEKNTSNKYDTVFP